MRGAGKVHDSLARVAKPNGQRVKNKTKKKTRLVRNRLLPKYGLRLNTLKNKLEEEDPSDIGVRKIFLKAIRFINLFTKNYDTVMESANEDKRSNDSLFAVMLAIHISSVVEEYDRIIDDEDLYNSAEELLIDPTEFLEDFTEFVTEKKIADKFANISIKHFKKSAPNRMEFNNKSFEELDEKYKEYRGLLEDTITAVKKTIKEYSLDEKIKPKIAVNNEVNDLIEGMFFMKLNRENKSVNDLSNMLNKLGL